MDMYELQLSKIYFDPSRANDYDIENKSRDEINMLNQVKMGHQSTLSPILPLPEHIPSEFSEYLSEPIMMKRN